MGPGLGWWPGRGWVEAGPRGGGQGLAEGAGLGRGRASLRERRRGGGPGQRTTAGGKAEGPRPAWGWEGSGDGVAGGDGVVAAFAGADADGVFDWEDEDFTVADFAGVGGFGDGVDDLVAAGVVDDDFDFDFRDEVDGVFAAAVDFGVAFLAAEAADFGDGHALDADFRESRFHVFEFEGLDDGFDFFHGGYGG